MMSKLKLHIQSRKNFDDNFVRSEKIKDFKQRRSK